MQYFGGVVWLEIFHYLGIAFWIGSVAMLDFRLIGLSRKVPVQAFHLSVGAFVGLALTVTTGLMMYLSAAFVTPLLTNVRPCNPSNSKPARTSAESCSDKTRGFCMLLSFK